MPSWLTVFLPVAVAFSGWLYTMLHRRNVVRSSLTAQVASLVDRISKEQDYVQDNDATWFPLLPYFQQKDGPFDAAGVLSPRETESLVRLYFVYRERMTYIARKGTLLKAVNGVDDVIQLTVSGEDKKRYIKDLDELLLAARDADEELSRRPLRISAVPKAKALPHLASLSEKV